MNLMDSFDTTYTLRDDLSAILELHIYFQKLANSQSVVEGYDNDMCINKVIIISDFQTVNDKKRFGLEKKLDLVSGKSMAATPTRKKNQIYLELLIKTLKSNQSFGLLVAKARNQILIKLRMKKVNFTRGIGQSNKQEMFKKVSF